MIEQINSWMDAATHTLGKLNGLPGYVLVFIWCLVFGYLLRFIKQFPNHAIPLTVVLWGMIWNMLIADPVSDTMPFRIWLFKNSVVGGIIGCAAWFIHWQIISRVEEKWPRLKRALKHRRKEKLEHETRILARKTKQAK